MLRIAAERIAFSDRTFLHSCVISSFANQIQDTAQNRKMLGTGDADPIAQQPLRIFLIAKRIGDLNMFLSRSRNY